jgi:DNA-binding CsgD family transcriptional regulator
MTKREFEILQMLSQGKSEQEITSTMGMVADRLGNYLQVLMVKYGVDTLDRLRQIARNIFSNEAQNRQ